MNHHAYIDRFSRTFTFLAAYAILLCLTMARNPGIAVNRISECSGMAAILLMVVIASLHLCKIRPVHPVFIVMPAFGDTFLLAGAFVLQFMPTLYS